MIVDFRLLERSENPDLSGINQKVKNKEQEIRDLSSE